MMNQSNIVLGTNVLMLYKRERERERGGTAEHRVGSWETL